MEIKFYSSEIDMGSKSPKNKLRRTYTKRSGKQKLIDAIEEIRSLVERHCGTSTENLTKVAAKAATETVARLSPVIPSLAPLTATQAPNPFNSFSPVAAPVSVQEPVIPMAAVAPAKPKKLTCPGGPVLYNSFIMKIFQKLKEAGNEIEYQEVKLMAGDYWKKVKEAICYTENGEELLEQFASEAAGAIGAGNNSTNYNQLVQQKTAGIANEIKTKKEAQKKIRIPAAKVTVELPEGISSAERREYFPNAVAKLNIPGAMNFNALAKQYGTQNKTKTKKTRKTKVAKTNFNLNAIKANIASMGGPIEAAPFVPVGTKKTKTKKANAVAKTTTNASSNALNAILKKLANKRAAEGKGANATKKAKKSVKIQLNNKVVKPANSLAPTTLPGMTPAPMKSLFQNVREQPTSIARAQASLAANPFNNSPVASSAAVKNNIPLNTNINGGVKQVEIDDKLYYMNTATKGLYEVDEETGGYGPWIGYRQNNGSIEYTDEPRE